jgi:hypothetical protein
MNMGIGDAVDLGWKLAASLQGWGGPALPATYELERKPVHERVIRAAVESYALVGEQLVRENIERPGAEGDRVRREVGALILRDKLPEFRSLGVVLGYRYRDSPILVSDGTSPPPEQDIEYHPSAHPGCLAPHLWLADGSSLYDHFGPGFTLLAAPGVEKGKASRLQQAAAAAGVPLKLYPVSDSRFAQLYQADFALVRPDQHVAWRGSRLPEDARALLDRARGAAAGARA